MYDSRCAFFANKTNLQRILKHSGADGTGELLVHLPLKAIHIVAHLRSSARWPSA